MLTSCHLCLGLHLPRDPVPSHTRTKILYAFLISLCVLHASPISYTPQNPKIKFLIRRYTLIYTRFIFTRVSSHMRLARFLTKVKQIMLLNCKQCLRLCRTHTQHLLKASQSCLSKKHSETTNLPEWSPLRDRQKHSWQVTIQCNILITKILITFQRMPGYPVKALTPLSNKQNCDVAKQNLPSNEKRHVKYLFK
jgi:hypothetical protein